MTSPGGRFQRGRIVRLALGFGLCGVGLWLAPAHALSTRDALWHMVNDICRPMQATVGVALPCLKVDSARGFAVVRAPGDDTRILVVPTRRIIGVESRPLQQEGLPPYWSFAWSERDRVAAGASRPLGWSDVAMAVNSRRARTQDQLHIHVGCVDARLKRALAPSAWHPAAGWSELDLRPWAGRYLVKRIGAAGIDANLFRMVASEAPGAGAHMTRVGIGVVGVTAADGERGFAVLVNNRRGHAEQLIDHDCSIGETSRR
jgi:CDP-diacylglycerol pyrophosphatase